MHGEKVKSSNTITHGVFLLFLIWNCEWENSKKRKGCELFSFFEVMEQLLSSKEGRKGGGKFCWLREGVGFFNRARSNQTDNNNDMVWYFLLRKAGWRESGWSLELESPSI
jgi:hypothetical protein